MSAFSLPLVLVARLKIPLFRQALTIIGLLIHVVQASAQDRAPETLNDVLKTDSQEYQEAAPATKQLWAALLLTLERNDYEKTAALIQQFQSVTDFVEPYQKEFCSLAIRLLVAANQVTPPSHANNPQEPEIDVARKEIQNLRNQLSAKEAEHDVLEKKVQQAQSTQAVLGMFLRVNGQPITTSSQSQSQLAENEQEINGLKQQISDQETRISHLDEIGSQQLGQQAEEASQQAAGFRQEVVDFLTKQQNEKRYRVVIALANLWNAKRGIDPEIDKLAQDAIDLQKVEAKAVQIASLALKPAQTLIDAGKLWLAKAELDHEEQLIANEITDPVQLDAIQKELFSTKSDVNSQIDSALKTRDMIMEVADRDAIQGDKQFRDFLSQHPDYPNRDQDAFDINELKRKQIEAKYAQAIAAIEEVIPNDPDEAKVMIGNLFKSGASDDDIAILKSRLVKLHREIIDQEINQVKKDLDDAQACLVQVNTTYAEELKQGGNPNLSFMESISVGSENLVRARSLQAGGVKRLEMLLNEDADNITKSKIVGLLETEKTALAEMDQTLLDQHRNKLIVIFVTGIVGILWIGATVFFVFVFHNRKKLSAS